MRVKVDLQCEFGDKNCVIVNNCGGGGGKKIVVWVNTTIWNISCTIEMTH